VDPQPERAVQTAWGIFHAMTAPVRHSDQVSADIASLANPGQPALLSSLAQFALADVMGGHVPLYFSGVNSVLPHLRNGKLKAMAVTRLGRLSALPDVPASAETCPGFEAGVTPAVWRPARPG
jgi:hypothetical protein